MRQSSIYGALKSAIRKVLCVITSNSYSPARLPLLAASRLGLMPKALWKWLPVERTFHVSLPSDNTFRYATVPYDLVGLALYWRGVNSWEAETIRTFSKIAARSTLVLDIGANTGAYTLIAGAANSKSRILSFEPVPEIYKRLVFNVELNGLEHRCSAQSEAVSNYIGSARLHVPFADVKIPTTSSFHTDRLANEADYLIDVSVTTIDTILDKESYADSGHVLVKIDVEGFEDKVLEGMQHLLANQAPSIIVECLPGSPYASVQAILSDFGYRFFHLRKEGIIAVDEIIPDRRRKYQNFLCIVNTDSRSLLEE